MSQSNRQVEEPNLWKHAGELAVLLGGGLLAVAALCKWLNVPVIPPALILFAVAAVGTIVVLSKTGPGGVALLTAACGAAAVGWFVYARIVGPYGRWPLTSWAVLTAVFTLAYPAARGYHRQQTAAARKKRENDLLRKDQQKWPGILDKIGHKGVTYLGEEVTRSGRTFTLKLPPTGKVKFSTLAGAQEAVEIAAGLWTGAIRFERGPTADIVLLHVAERDVLAETVFYPAELRRTSINRPLGVGVHEDGGVCALTLREVAALIVGLRGSGKSNLINVLIAELSKCVDVVIFMIDLKGGRTALPWIKPWLDGKTPHPVIDWVATNRDEAERMLRAVRRGIDARAHAGAGRSEKVIPSTKTPAVILIVEELAVIFGMNMGPKTSFDGTTNATLAALGTEITQLGRSEAIDPVLVTQRGTVTMTGGGDLKSQCGLRIGLGVATEADASLVIPDDRVAALNLARLKDKKGAGIVSAGDARPVPVKFYRLEHDQIFDIAAYFGSIRPGPDPVLANALGAEYENRWVWVKSPAGRVPQPQGPSDTEEVFAEIVAGFGEPAPPVSKERAKFRELLESPTGRVMGWSTKRMLFELKRAGFDVARGTVQRWWKEEEAAGRARSDRFGNWRAAA